VQGKQPRPIKPPKVLTKDELADCYRKQSARVEDRDTVEVTWQARIFRRPCR
jgi:hypothetical protein